jgi:hypothetical protein
MIYAIFDNILAGHTWTDTGQLRIVQSELPRSNQPASPEAENQSLLSRLLLRSKSDPVMARVAGAWRQIRRSGSIFWLWRSVSASDTC